MTRRIKSGVTGARKASRLLQNLPVQMENRVLQGATMAGARAWSKLLKASAPVGSGPRSPASQKYGTLKKNIRVQGLKSLKGKGQRGSRVWTNAAFWGYFREYGTINQPANPWFRPVVDKGRAAALTAMELMLAKGLVRESVKLAKKYGVNV